MEQFERIEQAFSSGGADAVFGLLLSRARHEPNPRLLFETTIMQTRHRLGLPLIQTDPLLDVADEHRPAYETAFRDAAREAGGLCLESGDIVAAWPFYRAIGEPAPVAAALRVGVAGCGRDPGLVPRRAAGARDRAGPAGCRRCGQPAEAAV